MKRDFDLIRKILLYVEEEQKDYVEVINNFEGCDNITLMHHCDLLLERNLLNGTVTRVNTGEGHFVCKGLTWEGHDYLAMIKNDTTWNKIKKIVKEKGEYLTIEIISRIATNLIENKLGI